MRSETVLSLCYQCLAHSGRSSFEGTKEAGISPSPGRPKDRVGEEEVLPGSECWTY